ncbi:MAG: RsmB/NOP family class I SAM-dependent RNA methyltransferase [Zwartia sp.]|nr:RsmB/NOP family class I SAM-dependent RNA methyltransferase [Zwartia sp.]MDO9023280.1 RsmB/NOP family class I SAM-dependent RNA methyltransferase [Zwartia sp.]
MSNTSKPGRRPHGAPGAGRTNKKDEARAAALSASSRIVKPGSATERLLNAQPRGLRPGAPYTPGAGQGERGFDGQQGEVKPVVSTYVPKPRQPVMTVRLDQIRQVLDEVLTWRFAADSVVSHWFRAHPKLGIRDRAEVAEVVYDVLRHLRRYRQLGESGVGNSVRRLAIQGAIATLGADKVRPVLDSGELAWLDRIGQIDPESLSLPVRTSLPDWLFERIKDLPDLESLAASLNVAAPLDIRVNPMKADREEMLADLTKGNAVRHAPVATPFSPWGIRLKGRPAMNKWHQFEHGLIEVQDEGSQLLALLVGPKRGEMVIDFCAGAGGKTLLLGALMRSTGRLYAFDVSATRLAKAKPRFARSGLSNIVPVAIEHENDTRVRRLAGKAHRVLVDAPCSGVGTLRRNPDLKWRQSVQSLQELTALQARILASAARCVAPGGRLVYATCSILTEENQAQAEHFLANHPDFELVDAAPILAARTPLQIEGPYLSLRPDVHGTDGFFAAIFERKKNLVKDHSLATDEPRVEQAEPELAVESDLVELADTELTVERDVAPEVQNELETPGESAEPFGKTSKPLEEESAVTVLRSSADPKPNSKPKAKPKTKPKT